MTPSERDHKLTANPTGLLREGDTVTFNCTSPRVKPPPKEMYLMFTDGDQKIIGRNMTSTNSDGLTSKVSLEFTVIVDKSMNKRKLKCHYVTEEGKTIKSLEEVTLEVLCK